MQPFLTRFPIGCVKLILVKVGFDIFTGPRRKIAARYKFGFKVILRGSGFKQRSLRLFFIKFPSNRYFFFFFFFLWDSSCQKLLLADIPGNDGKVTSDNEIVSNSYKRYKDENRDYCSYFLLNFQATLKFVVVSVRLIFPKIWVDRFTGKGRESDVR